MTTPTSHQTDTQLSQTPCGMADLMRSIKEVAREVRETVAPKVPAHTARPA